MTAAAAAATSHAGTHRTYRVLVADRQNGRVQAFDEDGHFQDALTFGHGADDGHSVYSVAVTPSGGLLAGVRSPAGGSDGAGTEYAWLEPMGTPPCKLAGGHDGRTPAGQADASEPCVAPPPGSVNPGHNKAAVASAALAASAGAPRARWLHDGAAKGHVVASGLAGTHGMAIGDGGRAGFVAQTIDGEVRGGLRRFRIDGTSSGVAQKDAHGVLTGGGRK